MESEEDIFAQAKAEMQHMVENAKTVILGSVSPGGFPDASYAPVWIDEDCNLYVYISSLAKHTGNIIQTGKASAMLIEDEGTSEQLFARKRLTFRCASQVIERDTENWNQILGAFEAKFGEIMSRLRGMTDFSLIRLSPEEGRLVLGFARAFRVSGMGMATVGRFGGKGHRS